MDELPSVRFFLKGVVHSIKPYQRNGGLDELKEVKGQNLLELSGMNGRNGKRSNGKLRKNVNRNRFQDVGSNGSGGLESGEAGFDRKQRGKGPIRRNVRGNGSLGLRDSQSDGVYDMNLQEDGSYEF